MKKITFNVKGIIVLAVILFSSTIYSQSTVLGFETGESGGVNGGPFGNMPAPVIENGTGSNTSRVLKIVGSGTPEPWQGINLTLTTPVQLTTTKSMTIDVLSSTPITFLVKVNGGGPEAAAEVTHNGNGLWQTLTFTFERVMDGKAATANGTYTGFVIHAYWVQGASAFFNPTVPTPARTFFVDNLKGVVGTPPVVLAPTTAAPTPPNRASTDVISLFSNAYTPIGVTEWSTGWDEASISDVMIAGNATKKIDFVNFLGVQLASYVNMTDMTHFHMDYYINTGTDLVGKVLNPKLSNHAAQAGETNALLLTNLPTIAGSWVPLDVPLSAFQAQGAGTAFSRQAINQFLISSNINVVYVDNIYLHKNTVLSNENFATKTFKVYPNPASTELTIDSANNINNISVINMLGQEVFSRKVSSTLETINISNLQSGVYLVKVDADNSSSTQKFTKN